MNKRYFSFDRLLWGLTMLAWALRIAFLLSRGTIYNYLHPKMLPFAFGAMVMFSILALERLLKLHTAHRDRQLRLGYLIFMAPLLLSLTAGTQALGASALSTRLLNTGTASTGQGKLQIQRNTRTVAQILEQTGHDDLLIFDSSVFAELFFDMAAEPQKYVGRLVEVTGFVHRAANLQNDQVFITRLLITCCAADSDPLGIMASGAALASLADNRWVTVRGRLTTSQYRNPYTNGMQILPLLQVMDIDHDTIPAVQYIYPPPGTTF
jgi:putative membrane protein